MKRIAKERGWLYDHNLNRFARGNETIYLRNNTWTKCRIVDNKPFNKRLGKLIELL